MEYDVVVVGGGIAGLASAYEYMKKAKKRGEEKRVAVIEASNRWGGRIGVEMFAGVPVVTGAGVGRAKKDKRLFRLMRELGLNVSANESEIVYHMGNLKEVRSQIKTAIRLLKKEARQMSPAERAKETFSVFGRRVLGVDGFRAFCQQMGYTDFLRADAVDTVEDYGLDDNFGSKKIVYVDWRGLIEGLVGRLRQGGVEMVLSAPVSSLRNVVFDEREKMAEGPMYRIRSAVAKKSWLAKQVVMATPAYVTAQLVRSVAPTLARQIRQNVHSQPFIRVYVQFSEKTSAMLAKYIKGYTVLTGETWCELQKIIPMNPAKGVYMIAYADSGSAEKLRDVRRQDIRRLVRDSVLALEGAEKDKVPVEIIDMRSFYFAEGTHSFSPLPETYPSRDAFLDEIYQPAELPGVHLVNEAFSRNQGWVEGALESVENGFLKHI